MLTRATFLAFFAPRSSRSVGLGFGTSASGVNGAHTTYSNKCRTEAGMKRVSVWGLRAKWFIHTKLLILEDGAERVPNSKSSGGI